MQKVGFRLMEALEAELVDVSHIKEIEPIWNEGSLEGTDDLKGLIITLENQVETQLTITARGGILNISLSQLESVPTQKTYLKNY